MSENILEPQETEVVESKDIESTVVVPEMELEAEETGIETYVTPKEYTLVGDDIYIPKLYDDAPAWLKDLVNVVTNASIDIRDESIMQNISDLIEQIKNITVPLNQYTEEIISRNTARSKLNAKVTTLDSNLNTKTGEIDSRIVKIEETYVDESRASAISADVIATQINDGDTLLGSTVADIKKSYTDLNTSRAGDYKSLESMITGGLDSEALARASAVETLDTYVGIDGSGNASGTGMLADIQILQKQNDGVIETMTGIYDVMSGIESPNTDTDNDELLTNAYPYGLWVPLEGNEDPSATNISLIDDLKRDNNGNVVTDNNGNTTPISHFHDLLPGTLYHNTSADTYWEYNYDSDQALVWAEISQAVFAIGNIETRAMHTGDVYIKYSTSDTGYKSYERAYKFIKTTSDVTDQHHSTDSEGFTWALVTDTDAQNAYIVALNAFDLADGKRRIFVNLGEHGTPSAPYDIGDLWLIDTERTIYGRVAKKGDILRCTETKGKNALYEENDWVLASSYFDEIKKEHDALEEWKTEEYSKLVTQVDKKAGSYYQDTQPWPEYTEISDNADYNENVGDLWKSTYTDNNKNIDSNGHLGKNTEYIYSKEPNGDKFDYKWVETEVPDIVFDTIDTKKSIYVGNYEPNPKKPDKVEVRDMWITGDKPKDPKYDAKEVYTYTKTGTNPDVYGWVKSLDYANSGEVAEIKTGLTDGTIAFNLSAAHIGDANSALLSNYVSDQADKKVNIYSGEDSPEVHSFPVLTDGSNAVQNGDIYIWNTTEKANGEGSEYDVVKTYKYDKKNSTWGSPIQNNKNITALADLADGKRTVYSGSILPEDEVDGQGNKYVPQPRDLWIPEKADAWVSGTDYISGSIVYDKTNYKTSKNIVGSVNEPSSTEGIADGWVRYYEPGEVYQYLKHKWELATKYSEDIAKFTNTFNDRVATLQNQVDGQVNYYFFKKESGESTNDAINRVTDYYHWTDTQKINNRGDIAYNDDNENAYCYDNKMEEDHAWKSINLTENAGLLNALKIAKKAKNLADKKVSVFFALESVGLPGKKPGEVYKSKIDNNGDDTGLDADLKMPYYWYCTDVTNKGLRYHDGTEWVSVALNGENDKDVLQTMRVKTINKKIAIDYYIREYRWDESEHKGQWLTRTDGGLMARSQWAVDLDAQVKGDDGKVFGANSKLKSVVETNTNGKVKAGLEYDNHITIDDKTYTSGFGMTNWSADGDPATSEFWVNADMFRVSNGNGTIKPFSIISGSPSKLIMNGSVSINSIVDNPTDANEVYVGRYLGEHDNNNIPAGTKGDTYYNIDTKVVMYYNDSAWVSTKGFTPAILKITNTSPVFRMDDVGNITPTAGITLNTTKSGIDDTVSYKWYKDGAEISGKTSGSLLVPITEYSNSTTHTFKCIATGTIYGVTGQTREDEITIPRLDSATNNPRVVLSNENMTFPAPVSGYSNIGFTGGSCAVSAYIGSTALTYGTSGANTFNIAITASNVTVDSSNNVINAPTAMSADAGYVDIDVTLRNSDGSALDTITKRITYSLSREGLAAPIFYITNTDSKFIKGKDGSINPPNIPLDTSTNLDAITSYAWYSSTDGGSTWSNDAISTEDHLTVANTNYTTKMYKCTLKGTLNGESVTLNDIVTIPLLVDASEAITVINGNAAVPLATTALSGDFTLPSDGVDSEITVYQGSTKLAYVNGTPAANQWTASISSSGFSAAPSASGSADTYTVIAASKVMLTDNAQVTATITVKDAAGVSTTKTSVINYALTRKGDHNKM